MKADPIFIFHFSIAKAFFTATKNTKGTKILKPSK